MRETVFILHIALNLNPNNKRNHYENYERISKGFEKYKWWILVAIIAQLLKWMMNRKYGHVVILVGRFSFGNQFRIFFKESKFSLSQDTIYANENSKKIGNSQKIENEQKKSERNKKKNWKETKKPSKILANFFSVSRLMVLIKHHYYSKVSALKHSTHFKLIYYRCDGNGDEHQTHINPE